MITKKQLSDPSYVSLLEQSFCLETQRIGIDDAKREAVRVAEYEQQKAATSAWLAENRENLV
jgi:hypothetical protein